MAEILDIIDPVELTLFARLEAEQFDNESPGSLAQFFPVTTVNDIRYAYTTGIDTLIDEAMFRAWDAESQIGRRPGAARVTGELLPISRKIPLSEYAALRTRGATDDIVNAVYNDGPRQGRGIMARFIRARAELLLTGKISIAENGVATEYDSGRHGSLTIGAVSPLWSAHSTATPIANIIAWKELVRAQAGIYPNRLLISAQAMSHLQQVDEVRGAFMPAGQVPNRITVDAVRDAFLQLAQVTVEVYEPPPGMLASPIPANMVVLLRDDTPLGSTTLGTPLEALEPEYQGLGSLPGIVVGGWKSKDPITAWTHGVAIGLPLLGVPDLTLSAQVLA